MVNVYNVKTGFPEGAVLVDRTTPYGNPFLIGKDGTRSEVIAKFKYYFYKNVELQKLVKENLSNRDLLCHCAPKPCHAHIYLEFANTASIDF